MLDPEQLFEVVGDPSAATGSGPAGPVLVEALDGFIDAGGARQLAREHLLANFDPEPVVRFDVDQLLDYRARRPVMLFVEDHWDAYDDPQLAVFRLRDAAGTPFLLLAGPEPDFQWERFTAAVRLVVERLGARLTIGLNAIPMAVPHTRPVGVIAHASRKELLTGHSPWVNAVQVPGSAGHLLEYRLGAAGQDTMGFAVHVPHYVAQTAYPAAAAVLLECVASAGRLTLPTDALREQAQGVRSAIDEQVSQSDEVAGVVRALEEQYDAFIAGRERTLVDDRPAGLPTADELGAELERFLAQQTKRGDPEG